jgi:hypothetical protein
LPGVPHGWLLVVSPLVAAMGIPEGVGLLKSTKQGRVVVPGSRATSGTEAMVSEVVDQPDSPGTGQSVMVDYLPLQRLEQGG